MTATHRTTLYPFQKQALCKLATKPCHLVCVAPTGSGKSKIFEEIAQEPGSRTLLISPLIALARQHAARLVDAGLTVALSSGGLRCRPDQSTQVWIMSPEQLQSQSTVSSLRDWGPTFLVVDECHCIWEWGESFRPAFKSIPEVLKIPTVRRSLWLTATLPMGARELIRQAIPAGYAEQGRFELPKTLEVEVIEAPWLRRIDELPYWLTQNRGPGLIFTSTRSTAERIQSWIQKMGAALRVQSACYHAGRSREERATIELELRRGNLNTVVTTSAFGMGMDFKNLDWVLLWDPPHTLTALAQAMGRVARAGRDGRARVYWDNEDFRGRSGGGTLPSKATQDLYRFLSQALDPKAELMRELS